MHVTIVATHCCAATHPHALTPSHTHTLTPSQDLAARNILVSKEEVCKVADFGLSRETVNDEYDVKKVSGSPQRISSAYFWHLFLALISSSCF